MCHRWLAGLSWPPGRQPVSFTGVAQQAFIDRPPPPAARPLRRWRGEHTAADLPPHEGKLSPPVRPDGRAARPVVVEPARQLKPARWILPHSCHQGAGFSGSIRQHCAGPQLRQRWRAAGRRQGPPWLWCLSPMHGGGSTAAGPWLTSQHAKHPTSVIAARPANRTARPAVQELTGTSQRRGQMAARRLPVPGLPVVPDETNRQQWLTAHRRLCGGKDADQRCRGAADDP